MSDSKQNSNSPIWLLDVDGVLNAWPRRDDRINAKVNGYNISYDPDIVKRIIDLHNSGKVEIRWLTTWRDLANDFISPLFGWPQFEVVPIQFSDKNAAWWKLPAVVRMYSEGRRLIWTDDDIPFDADAVEFLRDATNILWVAPVTATGLEHVDIDRIEKWL